MPRLRAYVASPLGFTEPGRLYYRTVLMPALATTMDVVDPWSLLREAEIREAECEGGSQEIARRIGAANTAALETCDLLVAVLDGQEIDAGTAAEVGFAAARGLVCWGLRTDLRTTGEPGTAVSLQVQAFIEASGGQIVDSLEGLVEAVARAADAKTG